MPTFEPRPPDLVVASIAQRHGMTWAGYLHTLDLAVCHPADLSVYTRDSRSYLTQRYSQVDVDGRLVSIKGDFWRGVEGSFSRSTVLQLRQLAIGWEAELLDEMLGAPDLWRGLGFLGWIDCERLCKRPHVRYQPGTLIDRASAEKGSLAALLAAQSVVDDEPEPKHGIMTDCREGRLVVRLHPAPDSRVRWMTPTTSAMAAGDAWWPVPDPTPTEIDAVLPGGVNVHREIHRSPCPATPPDEPPTPDPEPEPQPEPEPRPEPDPAPDDSSTPVEQRLEELLEMPTLEALVLVAQRGIKLFRMVLALWRHHTPEGRNK